MELSYANIKDDGMIHGFLLPRCGRYICICLAASRHFFLSVFPVVLTIAVIPAMSYAQADSGEMVRHQQERERALRESQEVRPDVRLQSQLDRDALMIPEDERPCFKIEKVTLTGQDARRFEWAIEWAGRRGEPFMGRCLGSQGIGVVMRRVQNEIVAQGFITTRVVAQPQDLNDGKLELLLIPGRVDEVRNGENAPWRATYWNTMPLSPGDLLNLRDIEQGLENLQRVPTVEPDIDIQPSELPGESDLLIDWKQRFPLRASLFADDSGSESSGKYQLGGTLSLDHPTTR
ncbi:hypothetical protein BOW53_15000 [Solemya pervernicosa gill symbiont]|uniref:POTRA domain-containing protein n=1 Tax=Solemya pervernicosa gill symbiont TaxID=642797 RepID=A0A1T2L0G5_9GAMM|nr:hypothetical protein BOW53_15000 [Solemya pervernicosa gill symbiont]